jgi:predicted ribosomally synthesized peptide with SipW-like signal peptide
MKKIITSIGMIVFAGALIVGGTGAFFSDTETSTANVFTAGAIDLKIDSEQHYNNAVCVLDSESELYTWQLAAGAVLEVPQYPVIGSGCDGSWDLTDLQNGVHKFFNFNDVKPGDEGENTISIHIDSNESWMCADIDVTSNDDISCNDPELGDDATCAEPDADDTDGDLAQNLNIFTWLDDGAVDGFQNSDANLQNDDLQEGDNIWQAGETPLFSNGVGPLSDAIGGISYALADASTSFGPLPAGMTQYIGLAWCAGAFTVEGPGDLNCDGSTMDNAAQTDETTLDVTFRVEQARNNPAFRCTPPVVVPVVTTLTLAKTVLPALLHPDSAYVLTAAGSSTISGIEGAGTVTAAPVLPGVYTLTETDGGFPGALVTWSCIGNSIPAVGNVVTILAGETVGCDATNDYTNTI